jgi:hypothetical protein
VWDEAGGLEPQIKVWLVWLNTIELSIDFVTARLTVAAKPANLQGHLVTSALHIQRPDTKTPLQKSNSE